MFHDAFVALFAIAAGFTASGIVTSLYRLFAGTQPGKLWQRAFWAVIAVAGPIMLIEKAAKAKRAQSISRYGFWAATALCGYWSFAIGLFVLQLGVTLTRM